MKWFEWCVAIFLHLIIGEPNPIVRLFVLMISISLLILWITW